MKKTVKKAFALTLALSLLMGGGLLRPSAASAFPPPVSGAQWDEIWEKLDETGSAIAMTPGSDETQRNFAWQSDKDTKNPSVKLSLEADMSDAATFGGTSILNRGTNLLTNYVTVKNLAPGTVYYYRCSTDAGESGVYSFKTGGGDAFKAVMFSDIHIESSGDGAIDEKSSGMIWNKALEQAVILEPDLDFILSAGDNTNVGAVREYLGLYAPPLLQSVPFAVCMGNHDKKSFHFRYYMNNPNEYKSLFGTIQGDEYWFRYSDALFLVFDTTCGSAYDHYKFAKTACEANPDAKWRIALYHEDVHASENDKNLEDKALQLIFDPIISFFGIDAAFSGHSHQYVRTHVMDNGKVVQETTGLSEITDPKGTVFFNNTAVNHVIGRHREWKNPENVFVYTEPDTVTYNVLSFDGGNLNVKACKLENGETVDEFTIIKTAGNSYKPSPKWLGSYYFIIALATVYAGIARIVDTANFNKTF